MYLCFFVCFMNFTFFWKSRGHGKCGCCVCHLTIMIRCHKGPWFFFALFFFSLLVLQERMADSSLLYFFSLYWSRKSQWQDCPRWHAPPVRMAAWAQHVSLLWMVASCSLAISNGGTSFSPVELAASMAITDPLCK